MRGLRLNGLPQQNGLQIERGLRLIEGFRWGNNLQSMSGLMSNGFR